MTDNVEQKGLQGGACPPVDNPCCKVHQAEIERLRGALDDEMQAHCICVEARDNAILEADRLRAILFEANNRWRHDFGVAVEAATQALFNRLSVNNTDPWTRKP